jgi:hypothetical protein
MGCLSDGGTPQAEARPTSLWGRMEWRRPRAA